MLAVVALKPRRPETEGAVANRGKASRRRRYPWARSRVSRPPPATI